MKELYICMGSACHVKGADEIVKIFTKLLKEYDVEDKIVLKGSFCLGPCLDAVVLKYGDRLIKNVTPENAEDIFLKEILPNLE